MAQAPILPSGDVTFGFVDVVGSTQLLERFGEAFVSKLALVQARIARSTAEAGGQVVSTEGDGAFLAFPSAARAVAALVALQTTMAAEDEDLRLQLRMGLHRGYAEPQDGNYVALPVHVAARVCAAARAGQLLATASVVDDVAPDMATPVGRWKLRGLAEAVPLWRLTGPAGLPLAEPEERTNVPPSRTSFVGRDDLVALLVHELAGPGLLTLLGPGGVGKSRLASELALRYSDAAPHGVWMVELARVRRDEDVPHAVVSALGGVPSDDPGAVLRSELSRRPGLVLVLDNCEHVIEVVADLVSSLCQDSPSLRVLCTSREALRLPYERVVRVAPLAGGADGDCGPAEQLFLARAEAAGAVVPADRLPLVVQLCRHLDGLPLAIELAAARCGEVPLAELGEALSGAMGLRGVEARQGSLEGVVAWSDSLLPARQQRALRILGVLPGSFSAETGKQLLRQINDLGGDVDEAAVQHLVARSLIDLNGDEYRLLETVRAVARSWLEAEPALSELAGRALVEWALAWAAQHRDIPRDQLVAAVVRHLEVLCAAALHGMRDRDDRLGDLLFCVTVGHMAAGVPMEVRQEARAVFDWADRAVRSGARCQVFALPLATGITVPQALRSPDDLLALVRDIDKVGDARDQVQARVLVSTRLPLPEMYDVAEGLRLEALALCDAHPEAAGAREFVLADSGYLAHVSGRLDIAIAGYERALPVVMAGGNSQLKVTLIGNLGEALLDAGRPGEALDPLTTAVTLAADRPLHLAGYLALLGEALVATWQQRQAEEHLRRALELMDRWIGAEAGLAAYRTRAQRALDLQ